VIGIVNLQLLNSSDADASIFNFVANVDADENGR
jgi:hypothetical protein